ncbi:hypothetical protein ABIB40_003157 [Pedobacter sp. UYP30]|uniref:hypothetical protein n=1 Tax=Pedobacter sp. UYP30 TaxID=1756400 RepID=UPI0033945A78
MPLAGDTGNSILANTDESGGRAPSIEQQYGMQVACSAAATFSWQWSFLSFFDDDNMEALLQAFHLFTLSGAAQKTIMSYFHKPFVQLCSPKMAQTEIQRNPPIICPLGFVTSSKMNYLYVI